MEGCAITIPLRFCFWMSVWKESFAQALTLTTLRRFWTEWTWRTFKIGSVMKKIMKYFTLATAALLLLASCQNGELENAAPEVYEYTFTIADSETKAILGDECVLWESDDRMGQYAVTSSGAVSSNKYGWITPGQPAQMKVYSDLALSSGDMVYAYYPYSDSNSQNPDDVELTIPADQDGVDDMPMASLPLKLERGLAKGQSTLEAGEIKMVNLGAVVEFNIYSSAADRQSDKVKSVTFEADSPIAGDFEFDLTSVDYADKTTLAISGYKETAVVASLPAPVKVGTSKENAAKVSMVVAPGTYSGTLTVMTDQSKYTFQFSSAKEFVRSAVKPLAVDLAKGKRPVTKSVETIDLTAGYSNQQAVSSAAGKVVSVEFNKGSNSNEPKWYSNGTAVRIYGGGYFTVSADGNYISKIELEYTQSENTNTLSADNGAFNSPIWEGDATLVKFTVGGSKGHVKLQKVIVTYSSESGSGDEGGSDDGGNDDGGNDDGGSDDGGNDDGGDDGDDDGGTQGSQTPAVDQTWLELPGMTENSNYLVNTYYDGGNRNYTHLYDKKNYTSLWTAYPLNSSHMGSLKRPGSWKFSPAIDTDYQVDLTGSSYAGDYSRGHLIPNGSRNGIKNMQLQTFYVTNSVPQIQNSFNGGIWNSLENALQGEAGSEEIYIVTGVTFEKVGESKTIKTTKAKDDDKTVPVPNYFWKVVLKVNKSGNTVTSASTIGFWFEHKTYSDSYTNYAVSVDQIEKWTGFDFFVNLPDSVEKSAETNTSWGSFQNF